MLEEFQEIIKQYLSKDVDITPESRFIEDLGFNSYDFMSMLGEVEDTFDVEVEEQEVLHIKTVGEALAYIEKLQQEQ